MVDQVNNAADVLKALKTALNNDTNTSNVPVKVMGLVNSDPHVAKNGWIGLYVDKATYRPRTIGAGSGNWQFVPFFKVVVQASDQSSSENAYSRLEALITKVLNVVLANSTLLGFVDGTLNMIDVAYGAREDDLKSLHFEGAVLTLGYLSSSRR